MGSLRHLTLTCLLACAVPLAGQGSPARLVGSGHGTAGGHLLQAVARGCGQEATLCFGAGLAAPNVAWAGGTAYDAVHGLYWSTNGVQLVAIRVPVSGPCVAACTPFNVPGLVPGYVATGLAYSERSQRLWILTCPGSTASGQPVLRQLAQSPLNACQSVSTQCMPISLPGSDPLGGLALSERHGMAFYSQSSFTGPPGTIIWAASTASPCVPTCSFVLPACGAAALGPITGLAYDDCTDTLYASDGRMVAAVPMTMPGCTPGTATRCCPVGSAAPWIGLDLEPSHAAVRGSSCLSPPCTACAAMRLEAQGDPSLGNPGFALRLVDAPALTVVLPLLGRGPATTGVPALCGSFYPVFPPAPIVLPPVVTVGALCGASASMGLPVPSDLALCDANLCAQAVIVCMPALGTGISNALDLTLTSH